VTACIEEGLPLVEIASRVGLTAGTVARYVAQWIETTKPKTPEPWVSLATVGKVEAAIDEVGGVQALRPVWDALEGKVSYEEIRLTIAFLRSGGEA
jgi:ATP-dependent DNA helicase RecQ